MTCRVLWCGPDTAAWVCSSIDEWWGLTGEQSQRAYDLERDLERELELDPFEEADVEAVPTHVLELYDE